MGKRRGLTPGFGCGCPSSRDSFHPVNLVHLQQLSAIRALGSFLPSSLHSPLNHTQYQRASGTHAFSTSILFAISIIHSQHTLQVAEQCKPRYCVPRAVLNALLTRIQL
ncbi:hypothetical protein BDQ12DRAFT_685576, partial [Crucibulum laeve]